MREIKFRAWDEKSKTMIDWLCMMQTAFNHINILQEYESLREVHESKGPIEAAVQRALNCGAHIKSSLIYNILRNPDLKLMQFTGLHDKNGKEIYEGDLLISQTVHLFEDADIVKRPCQVVWIEDRAGFYLGLDGKATGLSEYLAGWKASVFEIIGNIHENPQLVEGR